MFTNFATTKIVTTTTTNINANIYYFFGGVPGNISFSVYKCLFNFFLGGARTTRVLQGFLLLACPLYSPKKHSPALSIQQDPYLHSPKFTAHISCLFTWVVVKIRVPFWVLNIIRHLIFRVPKKGTLILTTTHMKPYIEALYLSPRLLNPTTKPWQLSRS